MVEPPRGRPTSQQEQLQVLASRMPGGSDVGRTRSAKPIPPPPRSRRSPTGNPVTTGPIGAVHYADPTSYTTDSGFDPSVLVRASGDTTGMVYDAGDPGIRIDVAGWYQVEAGFVVTGTNTQPISMKVALAHNILSVQYPVAPGWNDASGSSAPFEVTSGDLSVFIDGAVYIPAGGTSVTVYVRVVHLS